MARVNLSREEVRIIWRIRHRRGLFSVWCMNHLERKNGHYIGDRCWAKVSAFIDALMDETGELKIGGECPICGKQQE